MGLKVVGKVDLSQFQKIKKKREKKKKNRISFSSLPRREKIKILKRKAVFNNTVLFSLDKAERLLYNQ